MFHDILFKQLIQSDFPSFIRLFFPTVFRQVDFSVLEWLDKEHFTDLPGGAQRTSDLVAKVQTRAPDGKAAPVSLLFLTELEARQGQQVDGMRLDERMFQYYVILSQRYRLPVFPMVVYIKRSRKGLAQHTYQRRLFGKTVLSFTFASVGLSKLRAQDYLADEAPLAAAFAATMEADGWSRPLHKIHCLEAIARMGGNEAQKFIAVNHVESYLELSEPEVQEFNRLVEEQNHMEAQAVQLTWADKMMLKGEKIGEARGEARGELNGQRRTLARLLSRKFGTLSPSVLNRLDAITTVERLEQLADDVLTATSLQELGLE